MGRRRNVSYLCIALAGHLKKATSTRNDSDYRIKLTLVGKALWAAQFTLVGACDEGCSYHGRPDIRKSMTRARAEL